MSQLTKPSMAPTMAPAVIAGPVILDQNRHSDIGTTADPMSTPMNR
jgi:hypothetical protein